MYNFLVNLHNSNLIQIHQSNNLIINLIIFLNYLTYIDTF